MTTLLLSSNSIMNCRRFINLHLNNSSLSIHRFKYTTFTANTFFQYHTPYINSPVKPKILHNQSSLFHTNKITTFPSSLYTNHSRRNNENNSHNYRSRRNYNYYHRPEPSFWDDKVLYIIIGLNIGVFLTWQHAMSDDQLIKVMKNYFTMSSNGLLKQGKWYTIITSMFSHYTMWHLFSNMFTLYIFGSEAVIILGARAFLSLYFGGGILGGLSFALWPLVADKFARYTNQPTMRKHVLSNTLGLGASGAVSSVVLWGICNNPTRLLYVYMVLPLPAALVGVSFIGYDLWDLYNGRATGGSAHVGGSAFGIAFYIFKRFASRGRF